LPSNIENLIVKADTQQANQIKTKKVMLAKVYGQHFPLRLQMESTILSQFRRFPGLRSSFAGLQSLSGQDTEIEFDDFLDDPDFSDRTINIFVEMEKRLGDRPLNPPRAGVEIIN